MQSTEPEIWRPILGYEGLYEVSDFGNVRSVDRMVNRGRGTQRFQRGGPVALNAHPGGYRIVHLYRENSRTAKLVHRLVLEAFVGHCPDGMEACHNDGDPTNSALTNLRWDSHAENNRDQARHGTHKETRKTHCPHGHELRAPNLSAADASRGRRRCLACTRAHRLKSQRFTPEIADQKYREIMANA